MEINNVILFGGGGHAKVVADCLAAQGKRVVAFIDKKYTGAMLGIQRLPECADSFEPGAGALVAIGDNRARKNVSRNVHRPLINAIHPSVVLSTHASIGAGSMILHRSVIQPGASVGNHVIVNTGAQIDHDCQIGDYVHLAPRVVLCGSVSVGEGTLVGAGAVITPGIKIGAWATIGAGAVIIKDIPDFAVVVGNPGRTIKFNPA